MTYIVLCEWPLKALNSTVNSFLEQGWSLYGDPFTLQEWGSITTEVCQAVVLPDTPHDKD